MVPAQARDGRRRPGRRGARLPLLLVGVAAALVSACAPATAPPPSANTASGTPPAAATPRAASPRLSLRIPYTAVSVVNAPLWVAADGGYFDAEGLDVEVEYVATSTTLTQAMVAGEIALANSGLEALVSSNLAGADLIALAASTQRFIFRLYATPIVTSFADLRGRRVAVTRIGTSTDTVARMLLQRNGLVPDTDATVVQVGGVPEIFAALQSGAADAGILSPPTMFQAQDAGLRLLADTTEIDIPFHQATMVSTRRFVAEQPDTVRRVLRAYVAAIARYKQDRVFGNAMIAKYTRTDDASVVDQSWEVHNRVLSRVPYPRVEAVKLALDEAAARTPEARDREPRDFVDDGPLRALEDSGYVAQLYR